MNPLQQGLKLEDDDLIIDNELSSLCESITTRIETQSSATAGADRIPGSLCESITTRIET